LLEAPLELLNLTKLPSVFNTQVPTKTKMMHRGPGGAGELVVGEGSPELAIKRHWTVIGRTRAQLRRLVLLERSPVSGGGGAEATRPLRHEFRRRERFGGPTRGRGSFKASQGSC
jgi:hypothetical protein